MVYAAVMIIILLLSAAGFRLKTVTYVVGSNKVREGLTLVLVSDLHTCHYGKNMQELVSAVEAQKPDMLLLCGDIFNDQKNNTNAKLFLERIGRDYPCYYVSGNHEFRSGQLDEMKAFAGDCGICVLEGSVHEAEIRGQRIQICGIDDFEMGEELIQGQLEQIRNACCPAGLEDGTRMDGAEPVYSVFLSHRPERIGTYLEQGWFDLILSGHAHGGQWRIPGILNGFYAPQQGLFPKYAGGRYDFPDTVFIVGRGLARESTPIPRIFNNPEVVTVRITHSDV